MYRQLLYGSLLIVATSLIHGMFTILVLRILSVSGKRDWNRQSITLRGLLISAIVLVLCYASLFEAGVWAYAYVLLGAISEFEQALYFSIVTFTTLGYGDVVVGGDWHLLASMQAANGIIIFGWTTAIVVALLQHATKHKSKA
jgi:hypothetical protein